MATEQSKLIGYYLRQQGFVCSRCLLEKLKRKELPEITGHVRRENVADGREWIFCDGCDRMIRV